ncbi:hypothetical protein AYI70_g10125 [Smittium culicis]|uniref:Uncharacterized protein n=1 Tax=Smittium culicis TaxID=133412 RepID=A0A1R1X843_9FUNG|nr:hypothetical protein AYI70_g10125 [Smittium culicis]
MKFYSYPKFRVIVCVCFFGLYTVNGSTKKSSELSNTISGKKSVSIGQLPKATTASAHNPAAEKANLNARQDDANVPDGTEDVDVEELETFPNAKKRKRSANKPSTKLAKTKSRSTTMRSKLAKRTHANNKRLRAKKHAKPARAISKTPERSAPAAPSPSKSSASHDGTRKSVSRRLDQAAPPPAPQQQKQETGGKMVPVPSAAAASPHNNAGHPSSPKLDYVPVPNNVADPPQKPAPPKAPYFGEKTLSSPKPSNSTADNGQKQAGAAPKDVAPAGNGQKQDAVPATATATATGTGEKQWGGAGGWGGWGGNNWGWGWGGNNWGWGGQGCGGNQYVCQGNDYLQCSNGNYIQRFCGYGTRCQVINNGGIICGY